MADTHIQPEKITKPIQLLGAWLAGLLAVDSCFLIAAARMDQGSWESAALTIAAIANVPLFLAAVFLLQTRFRPELQEDVYYSTYISQKTNTKIQVPREDVAVAHLSQRVERLEGAISAATSSDKLALQNGSLSKIKFGVNKHLEDKDAISQVLAESGVSGFTLFGSDEHPDKKVVSISIHLPDEKVPEILAIARKAGFRHYNFFDNGIEETEEQVLIGSYGSGDHEIAGTKI